MFSKITVHYRAETSGNGMAMFTNDEEVYRFRWEDVVKIDAYKRDLRNSHLICLSFHTADSELYYSPHEEVEGFDAICECIARHFPSVDIGWREDSTLPLEPKFRVLYEVSEA